jgi:Putative MetA-pathway of phenol degradation
MNMHRKILLFITLACISNPVMSQTLEPRHWSHLPSGINFIGLGTLYTFGEINFDPVLLIEDSEVDIVATAAGYIRTFDMFGKSARIDVTLPYVVGKWHGLLNGQPDSVRRQGFGDAKLRMSVNLYGAPALRGKEFVQYRQANPVTTVVGAALAVTLPTGQYDNSLLINLGENRWSVRPSLGVLHQRHQWQFELTGSVFLYGDNNDFLQGQKREQDPFWVIQGHIIYTFKPGLWSSFSGGYGYGSRSTVSGLPKADDSRLRYWKLTVGLPINARQGLNLSFAMGRTNTRSDANLNRFALSWSLMFGQ